MADEADRAQESLQQSIENEVARIHFSLAAPLHETGPRHCVDCNTQIPAARLTAMPSAKTCTPCQVARERGNV